MICRLPRIGVWPAGWLVAAALFGNAAGVEVVDRVAAVVDDEIITLSDIRWLLQYRRQPIPQDPTARRELYEKTLQQLVEQKLIAAEAAQTPGIRVTSEEVEARVEAYRGRFSTDQDFQTDLSKMEMGLDELRELFRRQLAVLKFVKLRFEPFIIVLPDQIKEYYDQVLVPQLAEADQTPPPLAQEEEAIRQILTVERTTREVDRWVRSARQKARVKLLLPEPAHLPNIPPQFEDQIQLQPAFERPRPGDPDRRPPA